MKITRENYEPFFLDYLDGNLEEHMTDEFIEFLQQNPDLKEELQLFEAVTLSNEDVAYNHKNKLYRHSLDIPGEFENKAIAWLEGDLEEKEHTEFSTYIDAHPARKKELELFMKTKLIPDEKITFKHKSRLYRKPFIQNRLYTVFRVAAIILVAITIWTIWPTNDLKESDQYADKDAAVTISPNIQETDIALRDNEEIEFVPVSKVNIHPEKPSETPIQVRNDVIDRIDGTLNERNHTIELAEIPLKKAIVHTIAQEETLLSMALQEAKDSYPEFSTDEYISDKLIEKIGIGRFSFSNLIRTGLNFASDISGDRFAYTTGKAGEVIALTLETRLVGFEIPVGRK
jgi:hypothetical protein